MAGVIRAVKPLNRWDFDSIRPGSVGSVGDVLGQVRLKTSAPDMPFRWDMNSSKLNEPRLGSNVQNGTQASFQSQGLGAKTIDSAWAGRQSTMTQRGWTHQVSLFIICFQRKFRWGQPAYAFHPLFILVKLTIGH
jgi:hypothetical protein